MQASLPFLLEHTKNWFCYEKTEVFCTQGHLHGYPCNVTFALANVNIYTMLFQSMHVAF